MADIVTTLDNRVSHWKLEEASGTRVDEESNGNDLTDVNTVTSATGKQGDGAYFDVANLEYLNIADADQSGLSISGDLSISAWIYMDSLPASGAEMWIANKYFGSAPRTGYGFGVANRSGNYKITFRGATSTNGFTTCDSSSSGITTGTWYHVVIALDVSADSVQFYVNNADWGNVSLSSSLGGSLATGSNDFRIGAQPGSTTETFDGIIDELTLTTDIITSGEVSTIYNSGAGIPYQTASASDIKSIAGITQANIKSMAGITNANIKSVVGVTNT